MTEIKNLWPHELLQFPEEELGKIREITQGNLQRASSCFYLYRVLHSVKDPHCALLGDLAFGRFSYYMTLVDSVPLIDAFAKYLQADALSGKSFIEYHTFLKTIGTNH